MYSRRFAVLTVSACAALAGATPALAESIEGLVKPSHQVTLSAPLDAIVQTIPVDEGERVEAQAEVARMDDQLQVVRVMSARLQAESEAALREAELVLAESQIMLDRATQAATKDAASEWEVRRSKLQRDQAQAGLDDTKDKIEVAKVNLVLEEELLKKYRLNAPFAGIVLRVHTEEGATLQRGGEIITLVQLDPLEAEFYIPIDLDGQLAVGQSVDLRVDAAIAAARSIPTVNATVKSIDPVVDSASRTFRAVLTIPNPGTRLPAGISVFYDTDATTE